MHPLTVRSQVVDSHVESNTAASGGVVCMDGDFGADPTEHASITFERCSIAGNSAVPPPTNPCTTEARYAFPGGGVVFVGGNVGASALLQVQLHAAGLVVPRLVYRVYCIVLQAHRSASTPCLCRGLHTARFLFATCLPVPVLPLLLVA